MNLEISARTAASIANAEDRLVFCRTYQRIVSAKQYQKFMALLNKYAGNS